uniref:Anion exchange protein 3 n=1 Tax=Neogobius melanostomus TaxID=47308 RepID=A0A8C6WFH6_9GOBI
MLEVPVPVRFLFFLLGPSQSSMDYHEIGRSFSTLMSDKNFHEVAYFADDRQDLLNGINEFLDFSVVLPPSDIEGKDLLKTVVDFQRQMVKKRKDREGDTGGGGGGGPGGGPLKRSGIPFGGLIHDIKRRFPHYLSDLKDAIDMQCLAAVIFIYFAALSPTITFGGLLADHFHGDSGHPLLSAGGQPLLIIGFSGPLLVFEEAFYKFCQAQQFEYLTGRVWIGFWLIVIVLVLVAAEGSFMVRYISPFTQEIFAFLISLIFIYETFSKIFKVTARWVFFQLHERRHCSEHPLLSVYPTDPLPDDEHAPVFNQPNTALLSLVLMMGTFFVAFFLRKFRNSLLLKPHNPILGHESPVGNLWVPDDSIHDDTWFTIMIISQYVDKSTYCTK